MPSGPSEIVPLVLLTRPDCGLCTDFEFDLAALGCDFPLPPLQRVDVDSEPELARRHGLDIPVLLWGGLKVCQHRLDRAELIRLLRLR